MSNPDDKSAAQSSADATSATDTTELTFPQQVNAVAKTLTQDEKGVWVKPEGEVDETVLFAATLEARRRNTESALGKTKNALQTETGMRKKLEQRVTQQVQLNLTPERADELNMLKHEDPDSWRIEMDTLEETARSALREELNTDTQAVSQEVEVARRVDVLASHNELHPDAQVTDEALANDIPPRITKKLEDGNITFEEFLIEASTYLAKPKVVGGEKPGTVVNIGKAGGGSAVSDDAIGSQEQVDYSNTVF